VRQTSAKQVTARVRDIRLRDIMPDMDFLLGFD
jgi:hypothetical protein